MSKRILVMDDDDSICKIFTLMLVRLGYEVETASRGETAIERYQAARQAGTPFSAVILDLTVQEGIGGEEALRMMKAIDPTLRAICASGQSREATSENYVKQGFKAVLPKPFRYQDVVDCLRTVLDDGAKT
jgi:two-component system, cell cycle sensor histidine kinase and response regulator CckA